MANELQDLKDSVAALTDTLTEAKELLAALSAALMEQDISPMEVAEQAGLLNEQNAQMVQAILDNPSPGI